MWSITRFRATAKSQGSKLRLTSKRWIVAMIRIHRRLREERGKLHHSMSLIVVS
jgi:hypothetical protein